MADTFDTMIEAILLEEGGYTNDPVDPGGETNWGITARVARANGYTGPMRELPRTMAVMIYRKVYWMTTGYALVDAVSHAIAGELLDSGVNMGIGTATKFLQRPLNAFNSGGALYRDVTVDGDCGPATVGALKVFLAVRGKEGEHVLLEAMNGLQCARYVELAEGNPAMEKYAYGWVRNRVKL